MPWAWNRPREAGRPGLSEQLPARPASPRRTRVRLCLAALALVTLATAGCEVRLSNRAAAKATVVEMGEEAGRYYFKPDKLQAAVGQALTLSLRNVGAIAHNLSIDEFKVSQDVAAGQNSTVTFTPTRRGTFRVYCNVPGHVDLGMVAELTVR